MGRSVVAVAVLAWLAQGCPPTPRPATGRPPPAADNHSPDPAAGLQVFIQGLVERLAPLSQELNRAYWRAATTGDPAAWDRLADRELAIRRLFADRPACDRLRRALAGGRVTDPLLARQVVLLVALYRENQLAPGLLERLVEQAAELERTFARQPLAVQGQTVSENDIYEILATDSDSDRRRAAWEAYLGRGAAIREALLSLVRLRNQAARSLGFADYYRMRLELDEIDPAWLEALADGLARATDAAWAAWMDRLRARLARRFDLAPKQIRPWHFDDPFFQTAPGAGRLELDPLFEERDPRALVVATFRRLGLDPGAVLARSDLGERPGKLSQALCLDLDRRGDVRILANLRPSERWTATLLHETAHALYHTGISPKLPWLLRTPAHEAVSEAVAILFGQLTRDPAWLERQLGIAPSRLGPRLAELAESRRTDELVLVRFCLLMIHFERELYRDPDQDLNRLWRRLRQRYQGLTAPPGRDAPDWAAKLHLVAAPVYFQNYLLGHLLASQLQQRLERIGPHPLLRAEAGRWLHDEIFAPGASLRWDELVRRATGRPLDPTAFVTRILGRDRTAGPSPEEVP